MADQLDRKIAAAWQKLASGVQVSVMDIPGIFRSIRQAVASGIPLDEAVQSAVRVYRKN